MWQPWPKPDMFGSPHEQQTIWTESNYKSKKNLRIMHAQPPTYIVLHKLKTMRTV